MGKITSKINDMKGNMKKMREHILKGPLEYRDAYRYWISLKTQAIELNALVQNWIDNGMKTKKIGGPQPKMQMINKFTDKFREFRQNYEKDWDSSRYKKSFG